MKTNLDAFKNDLKRLIEAGDLLHMSIQYEYLPEQFEETLGDKLQDFVKALPNFSTDYQSWYSEAKALIRQLLPDRLDDFTRHYEKPKSRKEINFESYRIEDCLQGLTTSLRGVKKVGPEGGIPHFRQQLAILKAIEKRFESSLFDIRQLVQADLFSSELDAARELIKNGFLRGAGAIAGVVLEKHLAQVSANHKITTRKKHPTISDLNDLLKNGDVLDIPSWRQIQRLGDIRNLCDHNKDREPTKDEVIELIDGVEKFTKTLY
ncbi:MAG: hypothetical protein JW806_01150 [Sedimentisphaerales bacterium]|nr:hypothetical protein [Sedimentisphaerales bacterium]